PGERTGSMNDSVPATGLTDKSMGVEADGAGGSALGGEIAGCSIGFVMGEAGESLGGACLRKGVHAGTKLTHSPAVRIETQSHRIVRDLVSAVRRLQTDLAQRGRTIPGCACRVKCWIG